MMNIECFEIIQRIKQGDSLICNDNCFTREKIKNLFYQLSEDIKKENLEYFHLIDYHIVCGDFIRGIKFQKANENYYMLISANSSFAPPQQIAIGKAENQIIYMMKEDFPSTHSLNLVAFPETSINVNTRGFIPKSYRDNISFMTSDAAILQEKTIKCLEIGLESIEVFHSLVNQLEEQNKRKKLKI